MGDERNRLTNRQRFNATKWLEKELPRIAEDKLTSSRVAEEMTKELGFLVTQRVVLNLAGKGKECLLSHQWPSTSDGGGGGASGSGNHVNRHLAVVVKVLEAMLGDVEKEKMLGPELTALWDDLVSRCDDLDRVITPTASAGDDSTNPASAD